MNPLRVLLRRRRLERSCAWSREQLERHQAEKLAALRRFASSCSPYYQRIHRGLDSRPLADLPILTKAAMMEHFDEIVTDPAIRLHDAESFLQNDPGQGLWLDRYVVLSTSGSTGRRGVFVFAPDEWLTAVAMITRPIAWSTARASFRLPRAALIASRTPWHYSTRISAALSTRLAPALRLDAAEPLDVMVQRLNDWQPDTIGAYPWIL